MYCRLVLAIEGRIQIFACSRSDF